MILLLGMVIGIAIAMALAPAPICEVCQHKMTEEDHWRPGDGPSLDVKRRKGKKK